jgi:DNA-binding LytR/AlgR family response regulator
MMTKILGSYCVESDPPQDEQNSGYSRMPCFEVDSANQGEEGLALIEKSLQENRPYSLAFVDIRMPPGWDGIETIRKFWQKYPDLEVVICTGVLDRQWDAMVKSLGFLDRLIVLIKPFEAVEVKQLAVGLSEKWRLKQQSKLRVDNLEKLVQDLRSPWSEVTLSKE